MFINKIYIVSSITICCFVLYFKIHVYTFYRIEKVLDTVTKVEQLVNVKNFCGVKKSLSHNNKFRYFGMQGKPVCSCLSQEINYLV